jgi:thioredoxin reductase (NADPH)
VGQTYEYDVVIVGAGPAGLTAGLYAGRAMLRAVMLERLGEPGGEILNTELIEDYPGFESIFGRELADKFAVHAARFGAELRTYVTVERIEKGADGIFVTTTEDGDTYRSPTVILTAGGTPVKLGVPGEEQYAGKGVSYCAICDGAFFKEQTIAVIGGGDAALEEADFLTRYAEKVILLHRREEFRASKIVQRRVFENPKIEVIRNVVVEEIRGDGNGLVSSAQLRNVLTEERTELPVTGAFIFIGFRPNTGVLAQHVEHDAGGYIITDGNMESSIKGLFIAGDVRAQLTRQVTTAAGDATTAAIAAEKYLTAFRNNESLQLHGSGGYTV